MEQAGQWGIECLTLYAFSDENWTRPEEEIGVIMHLLEHYLRKEANALNKKNVRFQTIGDLSKLSPSLQALIASTRELLSVNTGLVLNVAISYGARAEMTRAMRAIAEKVARGELLPANIDQQVFGAHLDTSDLPDPDLLIRTSGELRISNFLLWQSAYSEFYFTDVMWPDFSRQEFSKAIQAFESRERRFGQISRRSLSPQASNEPSSKSVHPC